MGIQSLIDEALQKKQDSRTGKGSGLWKPSMLGRCYRAHYWARKNEPQTNPPDIQALRVFAAGNLFHDFVQKLIPNIQTEVVVKDDNFFGYADGVTDDSVFDIKSQHSKAFWYMQKSKKSIREEKYTNWLQVMIYAKILNKPKGCLVFISKDDLTISEYVDFLSNWETDLDNELKALNGFWQGDSLPPAIPRAYNGKECQYCNYLNRCKEIEGEHKDTNPGTD